jgi:hypothetical protein
MNQGKGNGDEAPAVARVAEAAREVQAASVALEEHFSRTQGDVPPTLLLARLTAAMAELQLARESFDKMLASMGRSSAE